MNLYEEFFTLVSSLNKAGIKYAVIGGIALAFYDHPRFTRDIDLLVKPQDFDQLRQRLSELGYHEKAEPWTFSHTNLTLHRFAKCVGKDILIVDILLAGSKESQSIVERALECESDSGVVRVATRSDLIWLKQLRNSPQDIVDIEGLKNDQD
jgi:tetrahydromethanopterin S-methyltransferase subunit G